MNQPKNAARPVTIATTKITKKEVDAALAAGNTHAKFKNKGVQKRLIKNQEKVRRQQQLREQQVNRLNKDRARMQKAHATLAAAGKQEHVVDAGVAALGNLIKSTISPEDQAALGGVKEALGGVKEALIETIEPGSIGGDLVDNDYKPENFDTQHASQESSDDLFTVRFEKPADNQVMLNLYGDETNYKPLPSVGDKVGMKPVVGVRKFPDCEIPAHEDRAALREVNYMFDTLYYSPMGEVIEVSEEDGTIVVKKEPITANTILDLNPFNACVDPSRKQMYGSSLAKEIADQSVTQIYPENVFDHAPNIDDLPGDTISDKLENTFTGNISDLTVHSNQQAQMDIRGHALDIDVAATYPQPDENGNVKLQNSGVSGAFLSQAEVAAIHPKLDLPVSKEDPIDSCATDEVNRTIGDEQK